MFTMITNIDWIDFIEKNSNDILTFDYSSLKKDVPEELIKGTINLKCSYDMLKNGLKFLTQYRDKILSNPREYEFINANISCDSEYECLFRQIDNVLRRNRVIKSVNTDTWKLLIIAHDYLVNEYCISRERNCLEMLIADNPMLGKDCIIALYNNLKNSYDIRKNNITLEEAIRNHLY